MKDKRKKVNEDKITGFFDKDTDFKGELNFKGSFRIDGHFKGTVESDSLLIIGDQGRVEADIKVGHIIVNGEVKGTIRATKRVEIHNRGRVIGTVMAPVLVIEEGAYLEANCQTGEAASPSSPRKAEKTGTQP